MAKVIEFYIPKNFRKPLRWLSRNSEKSSSFARRRRDQLSCHPLRIERKYDVHSYTDRLYATGRFRKTVASHLPKLSQLEPCHSAPRLEPIPQGSKEY